MPKQGKHSSDNRDASSAPKRAQDVNNDKDDRIGLTAAFAPVEIEDFTVSDDLQQEPGVDSPADASADAPLDTPVVSSRRTSKTAAHSAASGKSRSGGSHAKQGRHGKSKKQDDIPPHMRKSHRMRRILIVIIILLIVILIALGFFVWRWMSESQESATEQTQEQLSEQGAGALSEEETTDTGSESSKVTDVPKLMSLFGDTQKEAVKELKHGATVTKSKKVKNSDDAIRKNVTIALSDEPSDSRSGTPTVYLGLNKKGKVIQAGYSAAVSALGYGSLSFSDAVNDSHIIEKTLNEAGLKVSEGSAKLPSDRSKYTTYDSDGTTVLKEKYSFDGKAKNGKKSYEWSAVLTYDYSSANASDNLADTIRTIYIYIDKA